MKVLLVSENDLRVRGIAKLNGFKLAGITCVTFKGNLVRASQQIAAELPDIVLLDTQDAEQFDMVERFKQQYKDMVFMLLTEDTSSDLLLKAIRAGFSEVIPLPLSEEKLLQSLGRFQSKKSNTKTGDCKVLSLISCKGGSGATFVASNLSYILASLFFKRVLLIDVNQYFGDASMYVSNQKPTVTLADVCRQLNRLDYELLDSSLIHVSDKFKILAAADNPASASDVTPAGLEAIIELAKDYYDFIVLDVGRQIDAVTVKSLDLSETIYPVVQLILPHIRDAKNLMGVFQSLDYQPSKIEMIVNRYEKAGKLKLTDLTSVVNISNLHTLPNEYEAVIDSINQGVAINSLYKSNAMTKALLTMAEKLTKVQREEKGLLSKLFGSK